MCLADLDDSGEYEKKAAMTNNLVNGNVILRNRIPSESKVDDFDSNVDCKIMVSPTTGSQTGSLVPSILGNKTRLSAPVTIPSKSISNAPQPSIKARESYFTTNVVNEVEDEESKICSNNNSQS